MSAYSCGSVLNGDCSCKPPARPARQSDRGASRSRPRSGMRSRRPTAPRRSAHCNSGAALSESAAERQQLGLRAAERTALQRLVVALLLCFSAVVFSAVAVLLCFSAVVFSAQSVSSAAAVDARMVSTCLPGRPGPPFHWAGFEPGRRRDCHSSAPPLYLQ